MPQVDHGDTVLDFLEEERERGITIASACTTFSWRDTRVNLIDTPGIREFGIWDMKPNELGGYFVEFQEHVPLCRFGDCTHDSEPGCAVQQAVDDGAITLERYGSYLVILEDVRTEYEAARRMRWRTGHRPDDPDEPVEEPDDAPTPD